MPKIKTRKSIAKRFKITGTGRVFRKKAFRSHILVDKPAKRTRALHHMVEISKSDLKRIAGFLHR